jgi:hypothetical protein
MSSSLTSDYLSLLGQVRWYQSESSLNASHPNVPRLHRLISSLPDPLEALNKANTEFIEWIQGTAKGSNAEGRDEKSSESAEEEPPLSFHDPLQLICLPDKAVLEEFILPLCPPTLSLKDVIASARVWDLLWFWVSNLLSQTGQCDPNVSEQTPKQNPYVAFCLSQLGNVLHSQVNLSHDEPPSGGNQNLSFMSFLRCWIPWVLVSHQFEDTADFQPSPCKTSLILYEVTKYLLFFPLLDSPHPIVAGCSTGSRTAAAATVAWVKESSVGLEGDGVQLSTLAPVHLFRKAKATSSAEQTSDTVLSSTPWRSQSESGHPKQTESGVLFSIPSVFESLHGEVLRSTDAVLGSGWGYEVEREPGPFSLDDLETLQQQIECLEVEAEQVLNAEPQYSVSGPPANLFGNLSRTLENVLGRADQFDEDEERSVLSFEDEADFLQVQSPSQVQGVLPTTNVVEEVDSALAACSADTLLYFLTSAIADSDVSCSTALNILDSLQQSAQYPSMPIYRGNGKLSTGFQELLSATERTMEHCRLEPSETGDGEVQSIPLVNTLNIIQSRNQLVTLRDTSIPLLQ